MLSTEVANSSAKKVLKSDFINKASNNKVAKYGETPRKFNLGLIHIGLTKNNIVW
jgi:hypothetical protein